MKKSLKINLDTEIKNAKTLRTFTHLEALLNRPKPPPAPEITWTKIWVTESILNDLISIGEKFPGTRHEFYDAIFLEVITKYKHLIGDKE